MKWDKLLERAKQEGLFSDAPLRSTASVVSISGTINGDGQRLQTLWSA